MKKTKTYRNAVFSTDIIYKAVAEFDALGKSKAVSFAKEMRLHNESQSEEEIFNKFIGRSMSIRLGDEEWDYDSEDEFFAEYIKYTPLYGKNSFHYKRWHLDNHTITIQSILTADTIVSIDTRLESGSRAAIEKVFNIFEVNYEKSKIPYSAVVKPKIFIGHGGNPLWRDIKDHLHDKHHYDVIAYEVGSRAGHSIRNILEDMLDNSSFAILIMTAEDKTEDGQYRARQNVIHEIGLFQGRLGFNRAIVLLEKGTDEFSNIHGIEQIRFSSGNISETYGDVLAVIKREFY